MQIEFKEEKGCQRVFKVEAGWEELDPQFKDVVNTLRKRAKIPGFRPGKVPAALVKTRFKDEIKEEVLNKFLPKAAGELLTSQNVNPVVEPYAAKIEFEEEKPFSCEMTVEVAPELPELNTGKLDIEVHDLKVTDEQEDKTLESLRERAAVMRPVEAEASEGDYVATDFKRKGQAKGSERYFRASAGSDHPVERALLGRKAGETVDISVDPPGEDKKEGEDAPKAPLAPGEYEVAVKGVMRREVPELNDDFAKDMGQEDLKALKKKVREDLEAHAANTIQQEKRAAVIDRLLERHDFPVPPTLVERQFEDDVRQFGRNLQAQGIDLEKVPIDWKMLQEDYRKAAEKKVRAYFLMQSLVEREGIKVEDSEVDDYIKARSQEANVPFAQLRARYVKEGMLETVRQSIAHDKAADLLISGASVKFITGKEDHTEEDHAADSHGGGADKQG